MLQVFGVLRKRHLSRFACINREYRIGGFGKKARRRLASTAHFLVVISVIAADAVNTVDWEEHILFAGNGHNGLRRGCKYKHENSL